MYKVILKDLLEGKSYPDAGVALYDMYCAQLGAADKFVVDLADVESLPSIFLNTFIGSIIDKYGKEQLKQNVSFANVTRLQAERLRDYLARY